MAALALRVLVATVLVSAGLGKALSGPTSASLANDLRRVAGLPGSVSRVAVAFATIAEIGAAPLVLMHRTAEAGLVIATALFVLFTLFPTAVLLLGREITCACFGYARHRLGWPHVFVNGLLLAAASSSLAGSAASERLMVHGAGAVAAIMAGVVGALLVLTWEEIAFLLKPTETYSRVG